MTGSPLAIAAEAYAKRGIPVFPVHGVTPLGACTCGRPPEWHAARKRKPGKHPVTAHGLKEASVDQAVVSAWWRRNSRFNIGLIPGEASGFWVLDIDGPEGAAALGALEALHGALPATPEQKTGKGRHLLFAWPAGLDRDIRNSAGRIGAGIDVRGAGGYIVAAPSNHENGNAYAWAVGRGLLDLAFAPAPDWLLQLAAPPRPVAPPPSPPRQRVADSGRATPYGEAAITNQCRRVQTAPRGTQNNTLWLAAIALGQLVGGGEIHDFDYALDALRSAGRDMCASGGSHWSDREEDTLKRGFDLGTRDPRSAPERRSRQSAQAPASPNEPGPGSRPSATPAQAAVETLGARDLWDAARPAGCWPVFNWLRDRGLSPGGCSGAIDRLRVHARAPLPDGPGPALVAPLRRTPADSVDGVALLPLDGQSERFCRLLGDTKGRAVILAGAVDGALLLALDLLDAWRLVDSVGALSIGAAVAPSLASFAGGVLGDRYGRVSLATPAADPAVPPWWLLGVTDLTVALRFDIRTPTFAARKATGGTYRVALQGEAAARFYGGLVEQAWRRTDPGPGTNAVRLLLPAAGNAGFGDLRVSGVGVG